VLSSLIAMVRAVKVECIDCGEWQSQDNAVGREFFYKESVSLFAYKQWSKAR